MSLGEKIRYLREVEGALRGLDREMTQQEVVRSLKRELRQSISQSYLSQIESGARPHLTNSTRMLLARFFKVHPGYLVNDPEGYHTELISDVRSVGGSVGSVADRWGRALPVRSGSGAGVVEPGQAFGFAEMSAVIGSDSGYAGIAGSAIRSVEAGAGGSSQEASGMSWETFYFGCFLIGFFFSLLSVVSGSHHLHLHLPRGWHAPAGSRRIGQRKPVRPSISEPSRLSWRGSEAPAICLRATPAFGRCSPWRSRS